ncbi:MAG: protein kinase [Chloroflexota bacterium]
MPFIIGESVGPYRIIEQLGQGGMATVYRAYHAALDRYVAIKVLHPAFLEDASLHQRFDREAKVIARLEHPNIVPIYDYAEHNSQPYLVMKFIEGETLKARLARGPLTQRELLAVVEAVGQALSYAHKRGVLHRDIKPSNILIAPDGHIYLADFGLARMAQSGASTLSSDMMLGTPQYISPEQARGERELDDRTDIYSFGVVLYELVVGRVPFSADTPFSIIHDHIYTPLPLPRAINPRIPEAVQLVLLKALDKDPKARFASVAEMAAAFRTAVVEGAAPAGVAPAEATTLPAPPATTRPVLVQELPSPAPAAVPTLTPPPATRPAVKRSRAWIWAAGGVGLTCLCLLAFVLVANQAQGGGRLPTQAGETPAAAGPPSSPAPDLERARAAVDSDPSNPQARQELAAAHMAQGDLGSAYKELTKAGSLYLTNEDYPAAAQAFAQALEVRGGPAEVDEALVDGLVHALFFAVESEAGWPLMDGLAAAYPDWDVLMPVHARSLLLRDKVEQARRIIVQSLAGRPDDPVANAVLAEMRLKGGNPQDARQVAQRTLASPATPDWLRPFLDQLIRTATAP